MTGKILFRSVRATFGRYLAILLIVALGVGFFTGLKNAEPAMKRTGQRYLSDCAYFDYQMMTSLGLTDGDADAFRAREDVAAAEGGYRFEAAVTAGNGDEEAFLFLSLPEETALPVLVSGRMPERPDECLADAKAFSESDLGTVLTVRDAEEELNGDTFTVVGTAQSPRYISIERGATALCGGKLRGFLYLPKAAFSSDVYHELLVRLDTDAVIFSDDYDALLKTEEPLLTDLLTERAELRYAEIFAEAKEPLDDARKELDDARRELDDAEREIADGKAELADSERTIADGRKKLDDSKKELSDARKTLDDTKRQISDAEKELNDAKKTLEDSRAQLDAGQAQLNAALASGIPEAFLTETRMQLEAGELAYREGYARYESARAAYESGKAAYLAGEEDYARGLAEYESGEKDYLDGVRQYEEGKAKLEDAEKQYGEGLAAWEDGETDYAEGLRKLDEIPAPEVWVLDRESNAGCVSFEGDIVVIGGIANAFPAFFVLIAALVCVTTMTRMVSEERTQIGTFKALGFPTGTISMKYILYAGSAALFGCVIGLCFGTFVLPRVIWLVYGMSYGFAPLVTYCGPVMGIVCLLLSVCGAALVTFGACRREFHEVPAELIRPRAPAKGKRILLERVTFFWKRLSFLSKVMLRNAFRYKKRMAMMLVGIAGCTALLVTGFGLRDSVADILNYQYDEIQFWDASVTCTEDADGVAAMLTEAGADAAAGYRESTVLRSSDGEKETDVIVLPQLRAGAFVDLHDGRTPIAYPGTGEIVVSGKLAKRLGVRIGDSVSVTLDGKNVSLCVSGVCENYIGHYAYLAQESAAGLEGNTVFYCAEDAQALAVRLRGEDNVSYVNVSADERAVMESTMAAMDYVVLIVIVCAGALAFIVLFNLTNINIMERMREVATVKVLGFRPGETASYILRENVMLSLLGGGIGLLLGKLLHRYVMLQVEIDRMTFDIRILPVSYLYAFCITVVFALLANLLMRGKLARVNMAESLKAVE